MVKFNSNNAVGGRDEGWKDGPDFYPSPPIAYEALLDAEPFDDHIWEPACGNGVGSEVMKARGKTVLSTDKYDWGYEDQSLVADFLSVKSPSLHLPTDDCNFIYTNTPRTIITNPPYNISLEFIEHALELSDKSAFLLRIQFIESQKRSSILDVKRPKLILPFAKRLPRMHKAGYDGKKTSSSMCFAWFVYERPYDHDTIIRRI